MFFVHSRIDILSIILAVSCCFSYVVDSKAFMDDSRLSKLVKKIGREDDRDRRITAAKQLKEYLKQPENVKVRVLYLNKTTNRITTKNHFLGVYFSLTEVDLLCWDSMSDPLTLNYTGCWLFLFRLLWRSVTVFLWHFRMSSTKGQTYLMQAKPHSNQTISIIIINSYTHYN